MLATGPMHTTALAWASRGRPVFPVGLDKRPLTPHGLLDATTDIADISAMWSQNPTANVAVRTGEPSGLVVLDIDGQEGAEHLHGLEREFGPLPDGASVVTPRGGQHYYFRHPGVPVKTTAGIVAPGIDVRGDGGYVLVPPSRTTDGAYVPDCEMPPAVMPAWLVEMTRADTIAGNVEMVTDPNVWTTMLRGIPQGRRNVSLARLTGYLLRRWLDVDLAAALVHLVNERCCSPPLARAEVERIIDSIAGREARRLLREQGR